MIAAGNEIVGKPYVYGGGHGLPLSEVAPSYDCSSSVAHLLWGGGLLAVNTDMTAEEFEILGSCPAPVKWVTLYASSDHVFMYVAGSAGTRTMRRGLTTARPASAGTRSSARTRLRRPPPGRPMTRACLSSRAAIVGRSCCLRSSRLVVGGAGERVPSRPDRARTDEQAPAREVPLVIRRARRVHLLPEVVATFADVYINWNYSNVAAAGPRWQRQRRAGAAAMQLAAAQVCSRSDAPRRRDC
jgi:hypothetical protein